MGKKHFHIEYFYYRQQGFNTIVCEKYLVQTLLVDCSWTYKPDERQDIGNQSDQQLWTYLLLLHFKGIRANSWWTDPVWDHLLFGATLLLNPRTSEGKDLLVLQFA